MYPNLLGPPFYHHHQNMLKSSPFLMDNLLSGKAPPTASSDTKCHQAAYGAGGIPAAHQHQPEAGGGGGGGTLTLGITASYSIVAEARREPTSCHGDCGKHHFHQGLVPGCCGDRNPEQPQQPPPSSTAPASAAAKPILKFSVSAILGGDSKPQPCPGKSYLDNSTQ